MRRPPEIALTVDDCFANSAVLMRSGARRIEVSSPILSVTAAAAASETSGSWLGYAIRSLVPSEENPAPSASRAQSTRSGPLVPITEFGRPIPMSMAFHFLVSRSPTN